MDDPSAETKKADRAKMNPMVHWEGSLEPRVDIFLKSVDNFAEDGLEGVDHKMEYD